MRRKGAGHALARYMRCVGKGAVQSVAEAFRDGSATGSRLMAVWRVNFEIVSLVRESGLVSEIKLLCKSPSEQSS